MDRWTRERPTTVSPITEPDENASRRPSLRLRDAACAVRAFDLVAVDIPMYPASPEKNPPLRNAKGVK